MHSISAPTWSKPGELAYVMVNCESGCEHSVMSKLETIEGVREVQGTFGNYDILIKIETPSVEALRDILAFKIRKIDKITCTMTLVCVEETPEIERL